MVLGLAAHGQDAAGAPGLGRGPAQHGEKILARDMMGAGAARQKPPGLETAQGRGVEPQVGPKRRGKVLLGGDEARRIEEDEVRDYRLFPSREGLQHLRRVRGVELAGLVPVEAGVLAGKLDGVAPLAVDGMSLDGTIYGVPESLKAVALYYNKAMLPTPPASAL